MPPSWECRPKGSFTDTSTCSTLETSTAESGICNRPLRTLLGQSALAISLATVVLSAVSALLSWRIALRLNVRRSLAAMVGTLVWVAPLSTVLRSVENDGFRGVVMVCGLGCCSRPFVCLMVTDQRSNSWASEFSWASVGGRVLRSPTSSCRQRSSSSARSLSQRMCLCNHLGCWRILWFLLGSAECASMDLVERQERLCFTQDAELSRNQCHDHSTRTVSTCSSRMLYPGTVRSALNHSPASTSLPPSCAPHNVVRLHRWRHRCRRCDETRTLVGLRGRTPRLPVPLCPSAWYVVLVRRTLCQASVFPLLVMVWALAGDEANRIVTFLNRSCTDASSSWVSPLVVASLLLGSCVLTVVGFRSSYGWNNPSANGYLRIGRILKDLPTTPSTS